MVEATPARGPRRSGESVRGIVNTPSRDDALTMVLRTSADMNIGDLVLYDGTLYVLRGVEPMSVDERQAELEDTVTGERLRVPYAEVEEPPPPAPRV